MRAALFFRLNFCLFTFAFRLRGGRALARETFARRLLGAGRAQVRVEVESEQFLDLRGDGRKHHVGEARKLGDDVPGLARRLPASARACVLLVEGARDAESDEDAD